MAASEVSLFGAFHDGKYSCSVFWGADDDRNISTLCTDSTTDIYGAALEAFIHLLESLDAKEDCKSAPANLTIKTSHILVVFLLSVILPAFSQHGWRNPLLEGAPPEQHHGSILRYAAALLDNAALQANFHPTFLLCPSDTLHDARSLVPQAIQLHRESWEHSTFTVRTTILHALTAGKDFTAYSSLEKAFHHVREANQRLSSYPSPTIPATEAPSRPESNVDELVEISTHLEPTTKPPGHSYSKESTTQPELTNPIPSSSAHAKHPLPSKPVSVAYAEASRSRGRLSTHRVSTSQSASASPKPVRSALMAWESSVSKQSFGTFASGTPFQPPAGFFPRVSNADSPSLPSASASNASRYTAGDARTTLGLSPGFVADKTKAHTSRPNSYATGTMISSVQRQDVSGHGSAKASTSQQGSLVALPTSALCPRLQSTRSCLGAVTTKQAAYPYTTIDSSDKSSSSDSDSDHPLASRPVRPKPSKESEYHQLPLSATLRPSKWYKDQKGLPHQDLREWFINECEVVFPDIASSQTQWPSITAASQYHILKALVEIVQPSDQSKQRPPKGRQNTSPFRLQDVASSYLVTDAKEVTRRLIERIPSRRQSRCHSEGDDIIAVFVLREDVPPEELPLLDHLPHLVERCSKEYGPVKLVPLAKGAVKKLFDVDFNLSWRDAVFAFEETDDDISSLRTQLAWVPYPNDGTRKRTIAALQSDPEDDLPPPPPSPTYLNSTGNARFRPSTATTPAKAYSRTTSIPPPRKLVNKRLRR